MEERIATRLLYLFLFLVVPFIVGAIVKMVFSSLNSDEDDSFALIEPYDWLGYWLDGFGILIIGVPLLMALILILIMPFS